MGQKLPPVAVCTECGTYTNNGDMINKICSKRRGDKRCGGVFGSAINKHGDWEKCRYCDGAGSERGEECPSCQGTGWGYIRDGQRY